MSKRRVGWLVGGVTAAAGFALLLPDSPVYLPRLLGPTARYYQGHPVEYWMARLTHPDVGHRCEAIHALGAIGADAPDAVPAVAGILVDDPEVAARVEAALALMKMGPASRPAVPALTTAVGDRTRLVRVYAILTLMRLGPGARPAVPALIAALADGENHTTLNKFHFTILEVAALALGRASAGTADGVPTLQEALTAAKDDRMRRAVAEALGEVGPPARSTVPQLQALLDSPDPDVRLAADEALRRINSDHPPST